MTVYELLNKAQVTLTKWKSEKEIYDNLNQEILTSQIQLKALEDLHRDLTQAKSLLQTYKTNFKKSVVDDFTNNLNITINSWFNNGYKLKIEEYTRGVNSYAKLIDEIKGGNLTKICGDACQSTLQLLISVTLIKLMVESDSFIFIDEVFSKFSETKIEVIPSIIDSLLEDIKQVILIEHKYDVVNVDDNTITYKVEMVNGVSTITPTYNTDLYNQIIQEVNSIGI